VPKLNREKLLEFLESDHSEELDMSEILRSCEIGRCEDIEPAVQPKRKRRKFYKSKLR